MPHHLRKSFDEPLHPRAKPFFLSYVTTRLKKKKKKKKNKEEKKKGILSRKSTSGDNKGCCSVGPPWLNKQRLKQPSTQH
jgi:hypothetical protein